MTSIITNDLEHCIISGSPNVCIHHVFEGSANRQLSDQDSLIVPLEPRLHNEGSRPMNGDRCDVHHCRNMSTLMHIIGEQAWIIDYLLKKFDLPFGDAKEEAIDAFRKRYGKNYL